MTATMDKKALAAAYQSMMRMPAWEDLERFGNFEREASMQRIDVKPAKDLSLGEVCEERGIRKGIFKIVQRAKQCRDGV